MLFLDLGDGAQLRSLEPWQAEEFFAHVQRHREYLSPLVSMPAKVSTVDDARELLQRFADQRAEDRGQIFGVWLDGTLAGGTMFRAFDPVGGTCELGVWLAPEAQGRGIMTRAAKHMIDWAIGVRGLGRVEWLAVVGNDASTAVAKRLGMAFEGIKRSDYLLNGVRRDSEVYSITAADYFA